MLKDIVQKGRPEPSGAGESGSATPAPAEDPWYRDDERKAEVNEAARQAGSGWLRRRRRDWLR